MSKYKKITIVEDEEIIKNKQVLAEYIKENPGTTIGELHDNCDLDGDEYCFFAAMIALYHDSALISDSGCYFTDEETRRRTRY